MWQPNDRIFYIHVMVCVFNEVYGLDLGGH